MNLMDDLSAAHDDKEQNVITVDGWCIKLLEGTGAPFSGKRYRITHEHKEYSWAVDDLTKSGHQGTNRCIRCNKEVPKEALGFLEILRWEP